MAAGLGAQQRNDPVDYLPTGAQSTALMSELAGLPGGNSSPAVVVYARTGGLVPADRARIATARAAVPGTVRGAAGPGAVQHSRDGAAAMFTVDLADDDAALDVAVPQLRRLTGSGAGPAADGLRVAVTGPAGYTADANSAAAGIDGTLLMAATSVVVVLLLLIYRSPVLWLLPMLAVPAGLLTASAAITLLARSGTLTVTDLSAGILNVLVFGAATDYALLLIARYREQLHSTADHRIALAAAVRATAPAIAASGGTVIVAMLCLLTASINSNRGLGPVAALGVAGGLLAGLTLLPALLAVTGRRVFWPRIPAVTPSTAARGWARLGARLAARSRRVWVLTALVLAAGAVGLLDARLGLPQAGTFRGTVPAVQGQQLLDAHFPGGASAPTVILSDAAAAPGVRREARATPGVVDAVPGTSNGGRTQLLVTLADQPDSAAAQHTVAVLRQRLAQLPEANALVGGATAVQLDLARGAAHDRPS